MRKLLKKSGIKEAKGTKKNNKSKQIKKSNNSAKKVKTRIGKKRRLSDTQVGQLKKMYTSGKHLITDIAAKFKISVPTLYNYLKHQ
jgi:hypothetical protein